MLMVSKSISLIILEAYKLTRNIQPKWKTAILLLAVLIEFFSYFWRVYRKKWPVVGEAKQFKQFRFGKRALLN